MSKKRSILSFLLLADIVSVFSRVSKDINLQFRSIRDKPYTTTQPHSKVSDKMLAISISMCTTNGSDLLRGRDEDGGTFRHENTYKDKT